jgi:hypothetical protein
MILTCTLMAGHVVRAEIWNERVVLVLTGMVDAEPPTAEAVEASRQELVRLLRDVIGEEAITTTE